MIPSWLRLRRSDNSQPIEDIPYITSRAWNDMSQTNLLRDMAFNRHSMNDGHHVSPADNTTVQIGDDNIRVKLVQGVDEDAFKRTLSMAVRATIGVDLDEPLLGDWEPCSSLQELWYDHLDKWGNADVQTWLGEERPPIGCRHPKHRVTGTIQSWHFSGKIGGEDWEEMLKGGLQTALESQVIVFAVSGVSRTCTHQLVRSRRAAFHQQSQRASYYGDYPETRMPESVWRNSAAACAFMDAIASAHNAYRVACEEDISYQDARYILPEGTTNYILCEYSVREFIDVYAYRGCSMFSWEIVSVMREMRRLLIEAHPWLEPYVKISCEKTSGAKTPAYKERLEEQGPAVNAHTCTFQGWENVEGQCDFPWARQDNRAFISTQHGIGRKP